MSRKFLIALDLAQNELQNAVVQNLGAAPSSPVKGQLYMNSTDNVLYWWDGTAWQPAKSGAPAFGSVPAETTFGLAKSDGVATTVARSDHTHGSPTHTAADHSTIPLNSFAAPTGPVNMQSQNLTNLASPSLSTDAASKGYVDNAINGLAWKDAARLATTANLPALSGLVAVDGVTPVVGDRILVKNQTTATANGLYVASASAWTRATDADSDAELAGMAVFIAEGATQADTAWVLTTNSPIVVGSTNLTYAQFGAGAVYTGGAGLSLTGNVFNVGSGVGIVVAADTVGLDTAYTDGRYALLASGAKRFAATVGGATSAVVTHNLATKDVIVNVYRVATPFDTVECDVERTDVNNVTLRFAVAPAASEYRCVVLA